MFRTDDHGHRAALSTAAAVTVLWSSSWVLIRTGLDDEGLSPVTFAGLRYGLASVVLMGWVAASSTHRAALRRLGSDDLRRLALLGIVFYALTQGAQFVAIDSQPAATTSLVLALTPLVVAVAGNRTVGERAATGQLVGACLVAAGAWMFFSGDLGASRLGMAAAAVGLAANATSSLLGRHVNRSTGTPAVVVTAVSMPVGALLLLGGGIAVEGRPELTARASLIVALLAVVNTAAAFSMWNHSLRRLTAIESAGINNTMLIQIAVLAWVFLDEPPGPLGITGILVVSLGIFLTQAVGRSRGR